METALHKIDMTCWNYNREHDVYWQTGIAYCAAPADPSYGTLGIFVPGKYFTADVNPGKAGTYTCTVRTADDGNGSSPLAPVVIPVETPGYSAMPAPDGYTELTVPYTDAGFLCVRAGCRGRDAGAPAGVTDLKAAIRYLRFCKELLPGDFEHIFTFGMSGGGAQSALIGATGDSSLYAPYLKAIGAVSETSDAVFGAMCWCPITNLDYANEAYEWNLGAARTNLDEDLRNLSDQMAERFAHYINRLRLCDPEGNVLSLGESSEGIYQSGSYYRYLKALIEDSLIRFLSDRFSSDAESAAAYVKSLNMQAKKEWVFYDSVTNTVSVSCIADFVRALKPAKKPVGAFDSPDRSRTENLVFGVNGRRSHFDAETAALLAGTEYGKDCADDLLLPDSLGNPVQYRSDLYNPLYFLCDYYRGAGSSRVAPHWRIRAGINQSDTALTTEVNLALALKRRGADVDFQMIWGQGHVEAEQNGTGTENFIAWVKKTVSEKRWGCRIIPFFSP